MSKQTYKSKGAAQAAKPTLAAALEADADADAVRAEARRRKALLAIMPTPEEDARITAGALADSDNPPLAEGEMANFKPARRPRGRPAQETTKVPTTMRLDIDVVASFKATGSGWQTKMNSALRVWLATNNMLLHRYYAKVPQGDKKVEEFVVMALDGNQAAQKVKSFMHQKEGGWDTTVQVAQLDAEATLPPNVHVIH